MHWSSAFTVTLNFSPQTRKVWTGPNLWEERIPHSLPVVLSKRMMLPHINGLYYPLGLAIPFTLQTKLLMRRLWTEKEQKLG